MLKQGEKFMQNEIRKFCSRSLFCRQKSDPDNLSNASKILEKFKRTHDTIRLTRERAEPCDGTTETGGGSFPEAGERSENSVRKKESVSNY